MCGNDGVKLITPLFVSTMACLELDPTSGRFRLTGAFRHFERYLNEAKEITQNEAGEFILNLTVSQVA